MPQPRCSLTSGSADHIRLFDRNKETFAASLDRIQRTSIAIATAITGTVSSRPLGRCCVPTILSHNRNPYPQVLSRVDLLANKILGYCVGSGMTLTSMSGRRLTAHRIG
jgi:hypothetical protein